MKFYFLILVTIFVSIDIYAETDYHKNKLNVKFTENSKIYKDLKNRTSNSFLQKLLGTYTAETFVNRNLLNEIKRRKMPGNLFLKSTYHLERIITFTASKNIDPLKLSKTFSKRKDVIYAEPLFKQKLNYIPNDSLFQLQTYLRNHFISNSWDLINPENKILIGIVDAGVDYNHNDLKDNIWSNPGETGTDKNGNDKRTNNIDDDNNGFIDDWRGWDFVGSSGSDQDNDPNTLNVHGTHVSGIAAGVINNKIGIAGTANNGLILPVKIGYDDPNKRNLANSYDGLLYAALMGAKVINCSWGSEGYSHAEKEAVKEALTYGPVIVAAAGNSGSDTEDFPSSYEGILSVSSLYPDMQAAGYTNYNYSVDIAAEGSFVMSTLPGNNYGTLSGTSMASPVVAGVAAMVKTTHPDYGYEQIAAHIKATSNKYSHDTLGNYNYKLGYGILNAYNAVNRDTSKGVLVDNDSTILSFDDNNLKVRLKVKNILDDLSNFNIEVLKLDKDYTSIERSQRVPLRSGKSFDYQTDIEINSDSLPFNYKYEILFKFYENDRLIGYHGASVIVNKSYVTLNANDISVTVTSQGNIAYNDYPHNLQGSGFKYKESGNMMYEGALIVATSSGNISSVARGSSGSAKNRDFEIIDPVKLSSPGNFSAVSAKTFFTDKMTSGNAKMEIQNSHFQFTGENFNNVTVSVYDIINKSGEKQDSVFAGFYIDWDILPDVYHNVCYLDTASNIAFTDPRKSDVPFGAIQMISAHKLNYFAIDNDGSTPENPGVYDGFTYPEKWKMLSGGIQRLTSSNTDASMVIGAGPDSLFPGDTMRVTFLIGADKTPEMIKESFNLTNNKLMQNFNPSDVRYFTDNDKFTALYPNPVYDDELNLEFSLSGNSSVSVDLFDISGKKMECLVEEKFYKKGYHELNLEFGNYYSGAYLIRIKTDNSTNWEKIIINK